DMLFLAKADNGLVIPHQESVNLREEVEAVFEFYDALAAEKSVKLLLQGTAIVVGDPLMLRRAISNLISNAVRHSAPNTEVTVRFVSSQSRLHLFVENTGDGISPDQLGRVFDRFYRADASRRRSDEGAGLGLAITRSIIRAHQGEISVSSAEGKTSFQVILPMATVSADAAADH
ncbi:MAG: ATP-binding protein, partial [Moraxellaceae bacterium]